MTANVVLVKIMSRDLFQELQLMFIIFKTVMKTQQLFSLSPPNFFFQLQGILQRCVLMVCLHSVPVRVPSRVPRPQSPSLATQTLHCHSPQSDLRSFFPAFQRDVEFRSLQVIPS